MKITIKETGETILGLESFAKKPPNQWAVGGTLAHRALEVFYSEPPPYRSEDLLGETYDFAWESLRNLDASDGIVSKSMVSDYEQMLENVDGNVASFKKRFGYTYRDITMNIFGMEDPESVEVVGNESFIHASVGRMRINGKIDRVDLNMRGQERIVDYKTGKFPDGDISVFNKTFLPAGIYSLAREDEMSDDIDARDIVGVQLMYLKDSRSASIRTLGNDVLADVEDILMMVDREMDKIGETGLLPTAPSASLDAMPCKYCPLREFCPEWEG